MKQIKAHQLPGLPEDPEHKDIIAKFKSKFGISYHKLAALLDIDLKTSRDWAENDTAPPEVKALIIKINNLMEYCISEGELLSDNVEYIQVLKKEIEIANSTNKLLTENSRGLNQLNKDLRITLAKYQNANLWSRIKYVFKYAGI